MQGVKKKLIDKPSPSNTGSATTTEHLMDVDVFVIQSSQIINLSISYLKVEKVSTPIVPVTPSGFIS
jgi:hypothetical protein